MEEIIQDRRNEWTLYGCAFYKCCLSCGSLHVPAIICSFHIISSTDGIFLFHIVQLHYLHHSATIHMHSQSYFYSALFMKLRKLLQSLPFCSKLYHIIRYFSLCFTQVTITIVFLLFICNILPRVQKPESNNTFYR